MMKMKPKQENLLGIYTLKLLVGFVLLISFSHCGLEGFDESQDLLEFVVDLRYIPPEEGVTENGIHIQFTCYNTESYFDGYNIYLSYSNYDLNASDINLRTTIDRHRSSLLGTLTTADQVSAGTKDLNRNILIKDHDITSYVQGQVKEIPSITRERVVKYYNETYTDYYYDKYEAYIQEYLPEIKSAADYNITTMNDLTNTIKYPFSQPFVYDYYITRIHDSDTVAQGTYYIAVTAYSAIAGVESIGSNIIEVKH